MLPDSFDITRSAAMLSGHLGEGSRHVLDLVFKNLCVLLEINGFDPGFPTPEDHQNSRKLKDKPNVSINAFNPVRVRRNLTLTLVVSIAVANSFIIFPSDGALTFLAPEVLYLSRKESKKDLAGEIR
jgi:hypothetical protein